MITKILAALNFISTGVSLGQLMFVPTTSYGTLIVLLFSFGVGLLSDLKLRSTEEN